MQLTPLILCHPVLAIKMGRSLAFHTTLVLGVVTFELLSYWLSEQKPLICFLGRRFLLLELEIGRAKLLSIPLPLLFFFFSLFGFMQK